MNTVEKGDIFEDTAFNLIKKAIDNGDLVIPYQNAKLYKKKKYFSKKRRKDIIFDIAIEIWPNNAKRYSLLYLIECKDYSTKKVPIGDIELFSSRVNEISELNGKAIFITSSNYPESAINYAEDTGMMLIKAYDDKTYSVILHKKDSNTSNSNTDIRLYDFLKSIFSNNEITGLEILSKKQISRITHNIINQIDPSVYSNYRGLTLLQIITYFENIHHLNFELGYSLKSIFGLNLLGCYDSNTDTIFIDNTLFGTNRFMFALAHEIGHAILHKKLRINQETYNNFQDSEFDICEGKHIFHNQKHWIEWQANYFATNLILPEEPFKMQLMGFRKVIGLNCFNKIYLDKQPQNILDYQRTLNYLSKIFNTSQTTIEYRIEELDLIIRVLSKNIFKDVLTDLLENK